MIVLGLSAFYHDSAAAIVRDGTIVAAAQEERFTRLKHDSAFPALAVSYCLKEAEVALDDIDYVVFYDKPLLSFDRLLETYLAYAPSGFRSFAKAIPVWAKEKVFQRRLLMKEIDSLRLGRLDPAKMLFCFHHHSHAASAYYPSPFDDAAIVVTDGVGEWATTSIARGTGKRIEILEEVRFPHSLGLLYSAFTYYLGFEVNDGEYKVMGLAPYGEPRFANTIRDHLIDIRDDGSLRLNTEYFDFCTGLRMTSERFHRLFERPPRPAGRPLDRRDMDLAASVQVVVEEAMLGLARRAHRRTGARNLCLAGGVALNCVANGRILREGPFERVWIQPAAGDAGGAVGAALAVSWDMGSAPRRPNEIDGMNGAFLGPAFDEARIESDLRRLGARFRRLTDGELSAYTADKLASGRVVGWFQGRMEFGPRALGNRSILGDPRSPSMQRLINMKIKYRESFRPFAPAVRAEDVADFFALKDESPYMLLVAPVRHPHSEATPADPDRSRGFERLQTIGGAIPAVTHVDGSARIQTVDPVRNRRFHDLLTAFKERTGIPVLVNTSFNVRDEPIVCTPEDAYRCFMGSEMDMLAVGNFLLEKELQWPGDNHPAGRQHSADTATDAPPPAVSDEILPCLKPPGAGDDDGLERVDGGFRSVKSGAFYATVGGVPDLVDPARRHADAISRNVRSFYEEHPFPNYEELEDFGALVHKGHRNPFSRRLLEAIGCNRLILECGCGTGQLSHYLQLNNNRVLGVDFSLPSLALAHEYKIRNGLTRASFAAMDIFDLAVKDASFDVVISHGVLHHTRDARAAFANIVRKAKPGGIVIAGLYNVVARIPTWLRSKAVGARGPGIDPVVRDRIRTHETWHSLGEVIDWFAENDVEYLNCVPSLIGEDDGAGEDLFRKTDPGNSYLRTASQIAWIREIGREGGLFDVIGRRRAP